MHQKRAAKYRKQSSYMPINVDFMLPTFYFRKVKGRTFVYLTSQKSLFMQIIKGNIKLSRMGLIYIRSNAILFIIYIFKLQIHQFFDLYFVIRVSFKIIYLNKSNWFDFIFIAKQYVK